MENRNNAPSNAQEAQMRRTKWPDPSTFKIVDLPSNDRIIAISPDVAQNDAQSARREAQKKKAIIPMRRTKFPPKKT